MRKKVENNINKALQARSSIIGNHNDKGAKAYPSDDESGDPNLPSVRQHNYKWSKGMQASSKYEIEHKKNIQQQMKEDLLKQIEEKKRREEELKKKKMEEDLKEEQRIQQEIKRLNSREGFRYGEQEEYHKNQHNNHQNSDKNDSYLPELTNHKSEPVKEQSPLKNQPKGNDKEPQSAVPKFDVTASFANSQQKNGEKGARLENIQNASNNALMSESHKIKDMINQCDNKKALQDQITKRMNAKADQEQDPEGVPPNGPVVGDSKVGELSDIVKKLLEEQRDLKNKLNERDNIIADLSTSKDTKRKNTQERERRTRSLKPPTDGSKKVGSADNKSLAARKLREKHTKEKAKIDAIEDKIEKARRRKAEFNKEVSSKGQKYNPLAKPVMKNRPSSDFDPKLYKAKQKDNRDLMGIDNRRSSNLNLGELNVCKARAVESPAYSISSKIDDLNTQSRSKRSNYEYGNESKGPTSQKYTAKYSNIRSNYQGLDEDNINEDKAFMFSLPPDDEDDFSAYSLLGNNVQNRTPLTEFDVAASEGGDQIDLLMNAYSRGNMRGPNQNQVPVSDLTTSLGMNYSPNINEMYVINQEDNLNG